MNLPKKLTNKLKLREENNSLRVLKTPSNLIDFSSNDYLGFSKSEKIFNKTHQFLIAKNCKQNGATGSRLLSGNHFLYNEVETFLSEFHKTEAATIFNSGYNANIGFFSSVPQRGDVILYDELSHASIRDGILLSNAKSFKFLHNNLEDLQYQIERSRDFIKGEIYVVTESVFSMDGDTPDLVSIAKICKKHNALLIVDEAHAIGVFGKNGCGIVQQLNIQNDVFARVITFGKALGCHAAAILGSKGLNEYLVNFARSFIYTTGLSPHSLATIKVSYQEMQNQVQHKQKLAENIAFFKSEIEILQLKNLFIESNSAIHCCIISGNNNVKKISLQLQKNGFNVKAILSPTVKEEKERLRFCIHNYNSKEEISKILELLSTLLHLP
jgi:8-amino-7-oxononanoate synthase